MNIAVVLKEVKSQALKEIISDLDGIVENVRDKKITYQQGNMEIVGRKHIIQGLALDWAFNRKAKAIDIS